MRPYRHRVLITALLTVIALFIAGHACALRGYGAQRCLEYDFVVAPGADPTRITLAVTGAQALGVDATADLMVNTASGVLRPRKPLIYQEVGGVRREAAGGYACFGKHDIGFRVAAYDARRPLLIAGNAYVTGLTRSSDFHAGNALQATLGGGYDVFVAKLNAAGSALVYSTFLGGSGPTTISATALSSSDALSG